MMKFYQKITLVFFCITLLIAAIISLFVYSVTVSSLKKHITDRLQNQAFHTMDKLDRLLYERTADLKALAADPVISSRGANPRQITERLRKHQTEYRQYTSLSFFDMNRLRLADTRGLDIGKRHPLSEYWTDISKGKDIVMEFSLSGSNGSNVFNFAAIVKDKRGLPIGVVVSRMPLEIVFDTATQAVGIYAATFKKDLSIDLADKNGLLLYSNYNKGGIFKERQIDWDIVSKLKAAGHTNGDTKYTNPKEDLGEELLVFAKEQGYMDFKGSDWTLIIYLPAKIAFAAAVELRNNLLLLLFFIGFPSLGLVFLSSRRISQTIERLSISLKAVAGGDLEVRVESLAKDETGLMAETFNYMVSELKEQRSSLYANKQELEAAYSQLKKLFKAIEQAGEGIVITDIDGTMQYVNPAFTAMTGYRAEECLGKNPRILNSGMNPPELFEDLWKTILSNRKWTNIIINKKKTGEIYHEEMVITPVLNEAGAITNFIVIRKDISERIAAEEQLKTKNIELENARLAAEAANRVKSEFLANMSHELRTPLNHIIGFSEMMREGMAGPMTEKQREYSGDIAESGNRLLSLLNDILELSRIDTGETALELYEFDIRRTLERSLVLFKEKALKHNIKTSLEIEEGVETITADQNKLKQVVVSLLDNALKFTPDGGSVSVQARRVSSSELPTAADRRGLSRADAGVGSDRDFLEISVEDTGIGITEEDQKRLFKSFEQLESAYTKTHGGAGLGLHLSKRLLEMHGGRIWVESRKGKGSKFIFIVPV